MQFDWGGNCLLWGENYSKVKIAPKIGSPNHELSFVCWQNYDIIMDKMSKEFVLGWNRLIEFWNEIIQGGNRLLNYGRKLSWTRLLDGVTNENYPRRKISIELWTESVRGGNWLVGGGNYPEFLKSYGRKLPCLKITSNH